MTEILEGTLHRWMALYATTPRFIYLYGSMLAHQSKTGEWVEPQMKDALCNFDCEFVDKLKLPYFTSKTFLSLPKERQQEIVGQYGLSERLRTTLVNHWHYGQQFKTILGAL